MNSRNSRIQHVKYYFWENHTQSVVGKLVPDPFMNNRNWGLSRDEQCEIIDSFFVLYPS